MFASSQPLASQPTLYGELLALLKTPEAPRLPRPQGSFAVQGTLPAGQLRWVEIEDVGVMDEPLWPEAAEQLVEASTPAPFGWRDQTLLDPSVRHTGEIDADRLSLVWREGAFTALQQQVAQALGLPAVDMYLHNLLVYGPGQFFKPHQDTEKHPRMVATVVLVWPGAHTGGELRVRLGREEKLLASAQLEGETTLHWFAFYADCRHEVLPVRSGWRVALTFDVALPQAVQPDLPMDAPRQQALAQQLQQIFKLDDPVESVRDPQPWALLLDHEYTEHGLRWNLLKGADRWRVAALRAAAESLGLVVHLALAELHEVWSAQPEEDDFDWRRVDRDGTNARPQDLLDTDQALNFWVDADEGILAEAELVLADDRIASLRASGAEFLTGREYEGFMGNYGETLDYWYRRAALVIRTPLGAQLDRFELEFERALADLVTLAQDPAQAGVLTVWVTRLLPRLSECLTGQGRTLLAAYAELACALPDKALALQVLSALPAWELLPQDVPVLVRLERHHGTPWMLELLAAWTVPDAQRRNPVWQSAESWDTSHLWPTPLAALVRQCQALGLSTEVQDAWFHAHLQALIRLERALARATPVNRQAQRPAHLDALCELAQATHALPAPLDTQHLQAVVTHVVQHTPRLHADHTLVPFVQAVGALAEQWPVELALRPRVRQALEQALAQPERAPHDHSVRHQEWACGCADCREVITWAESPRGTALVWPAAEARRRHVEAQVTASGAPIEMNTLRQGRPYSLVLRKIGDLWHEDRLRRQAWLNALQTLGD